MKPIRTKKDYEKALARIDKLWDAKPGTKAYDELELLRRMGICEERGSGIDKVVCQTEAFQLPAPLFEVPNDSTRANWVDVRSARTLTEVVDFLNGTTELPRARGASTPGAAETTEDLSEVRGQEAARRALEIAAAGEHNLLLIGPPGAGKTMLARRLPGLLPKPSTEEALEIATIACAAGEPSAAHPMTAVRRPFRAPHHSASSVALVGGGHPVRPGEVTLAHRGVLFLDELPEFRAHVVESLRTCMERGQVAVSRARERVVMPARSQVVAAMNPCPCGYAGTRSKVCRCSPDQVSRYRSRVSGPMLDRFDMHVALPPVEVRALRQGVRGEPSAMVRARVTAARQWRARRGHRPADLDELQWLIRSTQPDALELVERAAAKLGLSARAYIKALRVARTIADLEQREQVDIKAAAEAVQYRLLDRRSAA